MSFGFESRIPRYMVLAAIAIVAVAIGFLAVPTEADDSSSLEYTVSGETPMIVYTPDVMSSEYYFISFDGAEGAPIVRTGGTKVVAEGFVLFGTSGNVLGDGEYASVTIWTSTLQHPTPGDESAYTKVFSGYVFYGAGPGIELSSSTDTAVNPGDEVMLTANVIPEGFTNNIDVQWTITGGTSLTGDSETQKTFISPNVIQRTVYTVTAYFVFEGETYSAEQTITVIPEAPVLGAVDDVTFTGGESATVAITNTGGEAASILPSASEKLDISYSGTNWTISLKYGVDPGFTESVTFTATNDGGTDTVTFDVIVNWVQASVVTVSGTPSSVSVGDVFQLTATVLDSNNSDDYVNQAVIWTSSDKAVTVDADGTVTVNSAPAGEVTITARATDYESVSGTTKFTVNQAFGITTITPGSNSLNLAVGGTGSVTYTVDAPVKSATATISPQSVVTLGTPVISGDRLTVTVPVTAAGVGGPATITLNLTGYDGQTETDSSVSVSVTSEHYTVTISNSGEGGSVQCGDSEIVSGETASFNVAIGSSLDFSVQPDEMYEIASVVVGGTAIQPADGVYTVSAESDCTVEVSFRYVGSTVTPDEPTTPEEPDYPYIPSYPDDDYVPIPPQFVVGEEPEDDTTTIVACAAAAVVAALMAVFLLMEHRKR